MKILTVARKFPSHDAPRRGAAVRDLVAATADSGVDARVISFDRLFVPGRDPEQRARVGEEARTAYDGVLRPEVAFNHPVARSGGRVPVARLPLVQGEVAGEPLRAHLEALRPFARDLVAAWRPDVIHAPGGLADGVLAAAVGHEHGIPVVVTVEDPVDDVLAEPAGVAAYQGLVGDGVRLLVTGSSAAARLASVLDVPDEQVLVLPEGLPSLGDTSGEEAFDTVLAKELVGVFDNLLDRAGSDGAASGAPGLDMPSGVAAEEPTTAHVAGGPLPLLVVASRRGPAVRLLGKLPRRLRRRLVLVVPPADPGSEEDAVAELGVRVYEARLRRWGGSRARGADQALGRAVLAASRSLRTPAAGEAVALDAVAAQVISGLGSQGVRLAPGGLRWLADRWEVERSARSARSADKDASDYQASGYWGRLHERKELSAVGQAALSTDLNVWLYRALERSIRRFTRRRGLLEGVDAVFDVGSGTGYWVGVWHDLGVPRVDGCDLVPDAVARLAEEFGDRGDRFVAADVGSSDARLPDQRYPLVSVCNVLLHITDDTAFEQALRNVAALVGPGGHLLLVEPALADASYELPFDARRHSRARRLSSYVDPLVAAGLELVTVEGAVAAANNPIEGRSAAEYRAFQRWWRWVARTTKEHPRRTPRIGAAMLALDRAALLTGAAPSSKFLLLRRPGER